MGNSWPRLRRNYAIASHFSERTRVLHAGLRRSVVAVHTGRMAHAAPVRERKLPSLDSLDHKSKEVSSYATSHKRLRCFLPFPTLRKPLTGIIAAIIIIITIITLRARLP